MNRKRWIVIIVLAVIVVLSIIYGFLPRPVPVEIARAAKGPMAVTVVEEGKTRVKDRFVVSAPVAGYLRRVILKVGDPVEKGQEVLKLEPLRSTALDPRSRAEAEASSLGAQALLRSAREKALAAAAEEEYAKENLGRMQELLGKGFVSKDVVDQAEREAKRTERNRLAAEAEVLAARHELERARATLRQPSPDKETRGNGVISVRSPVAGRVLKVHRESEGAVEAGAALLDVGDPSAIEVSVEVLSADAVKIRPGMAVIFERWGGGGELRGTVRVVEPAGFTKISSLGVEEQRVLVIADLSSLPEDWQRLGDGYRVEARFVLWEAQEVLQVPASAVFRKGEKWAVFVVRGGRAQERTVEAGQRNGLSAEIISGLSAGDAVIMYPDETVRDGVRVRERR